MRAAPSDQIRELMGAANLSSTADLKAAKKAAKANYAAELQAQMRANEEAKLRERMERLGIARPPPLQAPPQGGLPDGGASVSPGAQGPGMMGLGHVSPPRAAPPPYQSAGPQIGPPSAFSVPGPGPALGLPPTGSPGGGAAPSSIWSQPPPYQPNPNPFQPPMPPQYLPAGPLGNLYGMPPPNPSPPPPFGSANGYGSQPPSFNGPPLPNFGPNGISGYGPPPGGGYAPPAPPPPPPLLPGPAPPPGPGRDTMHRLEQQAKKDQYRLELEAQIREREERKVAEKARQREEDMRKEAEMAIGAREAMGRGGGGAPLRDAAGNVVANLRGVGVMGGGMGGMGPSQGFPGPGAMGMGPPGGMGMGPPGGMGMGHMMPPPPPPLVGSPPGIGMGMGMGMGEALMNGASGGAMMNGPPPLLPVMGGPPMMGSPQGMGPPLGMMGGLGGGPSQMEGGQPGVLPNFRFRSDNAYLTPKELDNKQRQMRELQEALEQQIQEKRRAKELEKHKEMAEIEREEARFRAGLEQQRGGGQDGGAGDGAGRSKEEVLADAWEKARLEAEELRRNKFAAKRGTGPVSRGPGAGSASPVPGDRSGGPWGEGAGGGPEIPHQLHSQPSAPQVQGGGGFGDVYPPPQLMTGAPMAVGRPSTPLVVEKVRQVAAAELAAVKQELAAEAAQLREVVAAQGQQVAALKSHAERMEAEAGRAREQVAAMRLGLVQQRGTAAPAGGGPAYDFDNQLVAVPPPPPPALADIDLDLPPTGAMLRRSAAPPPAYDMGPAIPAVNNSLLMVENAAASSINSSVAFAANGGAVAMNGRPPSRLRAVNPLEASMAGESVFIYPNGREMARHANGGPSSQAPSPTGPLPFQSIHVANRMGAGAAAIPTVVTTQELETGPLPLTPQSAAPASSVVSGLGLANSVIAVPTASIDAPAPEPMATGSLSASVVGSCVSEHQPALPDSRQAAALPTTLDVDIVMNRNKEKLEMLKVW
ncbi:hypothetical protein Vretimale_3880 [Volvox reticuliferus]|uniref:Uncharacterized protein n=1 Tax=Volvox reticuliferus TaxID=1737510 RepID=A0A8J4C3Q9_9CHLO|nr:hypothetical protein Vretifemale_1348 [Volvox reticuliferus]GIL98508.1 hypothetical protein Vretimale_3880 [Volvox reticuliferus]